MKRGITQDVEAVGKIGAVPRILQVVCQTTGMGFAAVARVTAEKWVACATRDEIGFGLGPGGELPLKTTICDEIRDSGRLVVFDSASADPVFCTHHTPKTYGLESYISVPIRLEGGEFFGTLCAIDPRPAKVNNAETIAMFELFAELIAQHLESERRVTATEAELLGEREASQLREQFIAVLGHDLRNPLFAIDSGVELLRTMVSDAEVLELLEMIQRSGGRMTSLISDVLDFARGRLGGGVDVRWGECGNLGEVLEHAAMELKSAWPKRRVHVDIGVAGVVRCDSARLAQVLSNLLGNALTHGDPNGPVDVYCRVAGGELEMSVTNAGKKIPAEVAAKLFAPFSRGNPSGGQRGLGLGLYIATEIAKAHGGMLAVDSTEERTRFTFRMPVSR